jgi:hypothetical protein
MEEEPKIIDVEATLVEVPMPEVVDKDAATKFYDDFAELSKSSGLDFQVVTQILDQDKKPIEDKEKTTRISKLVNAVVGAEDCILFNTFVIVKRKEPEPIPQIAVK